MFSAHTMRRFGIGPDEPLVFWDDDEKENDEANFDCAFIFTKKYSQEMSYRSSSASPTFTESLQPE